MSATAKQTSSFHWNSYGMMEYMLVLPPSVSVNEKVVLEMQEFYHQYGEKSAIKTKPYITIATFFAKEEMEVTLNRWIHNICNRQQSFELSLNNYSGFPPHTIYIRIQDPAPVYGLINQLKLIDEFIRSSDCPPLNATTKLHLTLARKLSMETFEKAMKEYAQKDFHESFTADELVLLKRSHEFDDASVVNKFRFQPGGSTVYHMS